MSTPTDAAFAIIALLDRREETVATAESLTGGLVCSALVDVPGASTCVLGGVVAYATAAKSALLDVDGGLLAVRGAVDAEVARQLADGARQKFHATWAVSTTGVAGPGPAEGKPAGTAFVAVTGPGAARVEALNLGGDRSEVRQATVAAALSLLLATLEEQSVTPRG